MWCAPCTLSRERRGGDEEGRENVEAAADSAHRKNDDDDDDDDGRGGGKAARGGEGDHVGRDKEQPLEGPRTHTGHNGESTVMMTKRGLAMARPVFPAPIT